MVRRDNGRLASLTIKSKRILAGINFAFAHPFLDLGAYYPDVVGANNTSIYGR